MKKNRKVAVIFIWLISLLVGGISYALAESDFPTRTIEVVIPYGPGGGMDAVSSAFKEKVGKVLGQPVITVFKPGAGGAIGSSYVAKSKPDGYTLLMASGSVLIFYPLTRKDAEFTLDDFTPVCNLTIAPYVMVVKDDSAYKNLQDFIEAAKTRKMKYSTPGVATAPHIVMEALGKVAGFEPIHVPYAGGARCMAAALGGHVDMAITGGVAGMVGPERLRMIGVTTESRFGLYPDVQTLKELGYPISATTYYFIWAPKGTPKERVNKISDAFGKVAKADAEEITKIVNNADHTLGFMGPDELGKVTYAEYDRIKKMLEGVGITPK